MTKTKCEHLEHEVQHKIRSYTVSEVVKMRSVEKVTVTIRINTLLYTL